MHPYTHATMNLSFIPHTLIFKRPFSIAHGTRDTTPVVFTQVEHKGFLGYGEASLPPYLSENHTTAINFLEKTNKVLKKFSDPTDVSVILSEIDEIEEGNTAAKAAVDIALHDLIGKIKNKPCRELFTNKRAKDFFTAYTIPIDSSEGLSKRLDEAKDYKILKIKLGSADDKKIINKIRKVTDKAIMVDVNEGWKEKEKALDMIHYLSERNVLLIEQPLGKKKQKDIAWLTARSPLPIIADESMQRLSDLENVKNIYSGINIKLMKCTGLHEAYKIIVQAKKYGMKILLGCMAESSCAVSAAAQLASFADWIDLDGPLLLKEDFFDGVTFSEGKIKLNELPGIGTVLRFPLFSS